MDRGAEIQGLSQPSGDPTADIGRAGAKEISAQTKNGVRWSVVEFEGEHDTPLRLYMALPEGQDATKLVVLTALDDAGWKTFAQGHGAMFPDIAGEGRNGDEQKSTGEMVAKMGWGMAWLAPRGVGPSAWSGGERKQTQIRRRFQLLGRTLDTLRVWDVARGAPCCKRGRTSRVFRSGCREKRRRPRFGACMPPRFSRK